MGHHKLVAGAAPLDANERAVLTTLDLLESHRLDQARIPFKSVNNYKPPPSTPQNALYLAVVFCTKNGTLYIAEQPSDVNDKKVTLFWSEQEKIVHWTCVDSLPLPGQPMINQQLHRNTQKAIQQYNSYVKSNGHPLLGNPQRPTSPLQRQVVQRSAYGSYSPFPFGQPQMTKMQTPPRAPSPPRVEAPPSASPPTRPFQEPASPPVVGTLNITESLVPPSKKETSPPKPEPVKPAEGAAEPYVVMAPPSAPTRAPITRPLVQPYVRYDVNIREASQIVADAEINGFPYNNEKLTRKVLTREGLAPRYKVKVAQGTFAYFSLPYELPDGGRIAVMAYVQYKNKMVARTYYLSNSQGIWRYLPQYLTQNGTITWYSKMYGEESIILPIAMQIVLAEISQQSMPRAVIRSHDPYLIFAGTARPVGQKGTAFLEVESVPELLNGNFYAPAGAKIPPGELGFSAEADRIDFSQKIATPWHQDTSVYGPIILEAFPTFGTTQKFIFCREKAARPGHPLRVWPGGAENESIIRSTGLRSKWIKGGDLMTPAFEYLVAGEVDQTGGYGNEAWREGPYVDMFENYLRHVPVIQEYMEVLKQRGEI